MPTKKDGKHPLSSTVIPIVGLIMAIDAFGRQAQTEEAGKGHQ